MRKNNVYRFEYITNPESAEGWGWELLEAKDFKTAKKWIVNFCKENGFKLLYIAKIMYESPIEEEI